jgi:hypothetical protein
MESIMKFCVGCIYRLVRRRQATILEPIEVV